jgi:P27 family predicted phage terminase small subunit
MPRTGRKPKSPALKVLGGDRKDRVNATPAKVVPGVPRRPVHLDDHGREAWDNITAELAKLGCLSTAEAFAIELYCVVYSRWRKALDGMTADGITTTTDLGSVKGNPAMQVIAQCERTMSSMLSEFGLTPSSRSRVKGGPEAPRDALSDFLNKRKA